jgi:hypothetical protein
MASDFRAKKVHFATGNEKAITSLFKKQPPKALTLQQFEARLVTAQARSLSILVERWPASHRSPEPTPSGRKCGEIDFDAEFAEDEALMLGVQC